MSCEDSHETPCDDVLAEVYIYLDAECDRDAKAKIKRHLDECGGCMREYGIEQEVKVLVARSCGDEVAPDHLRERLRAKLHALMDTEPNY